MQTKGFLFLSSSPPLPLRHVMRLDCITFVLITARVNLLYVVTPDWEMNPNSTVYWQTKSYSAGNLEINNHSSSHRCIHLSNLGIDHSSFHSWFLISISYTKCTYMTGMTRWQLWPYDRYDRITGMTVRQLWPYNRYARMTSMTVWQVWPYDRYDHITGMTVWQGRPYGRYDRMTGMTVWQVRPYGRYDRMTGTTVWQVWLVKVSPQKKFFKNTIKQTFWSFTG